MTFVSPYCKYEGCGRFHVNKVTLLCGTHERLEKQEVRREETGNKIARRSDKRAEEETQYRKRVKVWLIGKRCAVFPEKKATECHHKRGRAGKWLLIEEHWLPVSHDGHDKINNNPEWALEMGFIIKRSI